MAHFCSSCRLCVSGLVFSCFLLVVSFYSFVCLGGLCLLWC